MAVGSTGHERYENAACGLVSTRADGLICDANRTFCLWFGFERSELVDSRRFQDLLTMGGKIFQQTHWLPLLEMQGSVAELQLELLHRDGHAIPALVNAIRRQTDAAVYHDFAVFIAADRRKYERELLSARRRAEELLESVQRAQDDLKLTEARLRLALDSAELLVWDVDVTTGVANYEPGVERLVGLPLQAGVTAESYRERIHPADVEAERIAFASAFAADTAGAYQADYRLLGHDGVERIVSSRGRAFFDSSGRPVRFSGVLQDVTQQRRAEIALREQERGAQQRAVLAEQLIGIVSHDLRTPLNAISLGASILLSTSIQPTHARTVQRISSAVQRADRLIVDLLDFTQARLGGGIRVVRSELDLHSVVANTMDELKLAWPGRMMEHRREGPGKGFADPDRLSQVVTNLASNALTYGRPDNPVIIASRVADDELVIEVHNDGTPIPSELLPYIFEPLRRGEQQVKLGSRSVGLGLYIVQQIAAAHGGQVSVQSTPADGTTFSVHLPSAPPV